MALLDGAPRSADVHAETDIVVLALDLERLDALSVTAPELRATLLRNIGRQLSRRLRAANNELRTYAPPQHAA